MITQQDRVLARLLVGPLTSLEAIREFGILRLAAVVYDLKGQGFDIPTLIIEVKNRQGKTCHVAEYRLSEGGEMSVLGDDGRDQYAAIGLLGKLGVEVPSDTPPARMLRRLRHVLKRRGIDGLELTKNERSLAGALLGTADTDPLPDPLPDPKAEEEPPTKAEPDPEPEQRPSVKTKKTGMKGTDAFKKIFSSGKPLTRAEVKTLLVELSGISSATQYINRAKKSPERFGFQLSEEDGVLSVMDAK